MDEKAVHAVRILGIDPGLNFTGYGFVDYVPGVLRHVASGVIVTPKGELSERLGYIFSELGKLIELYSPMVSTIEKTFLNSNAQSSMLLSHARGAAMTAAAVHRLACREFSTREIKKSVTGYGAATKDQVQELVKFHLHIEEDLSSDQADALAAAICYANSSILLDRVPALSNKVGSSGTGTARRGSSSRRSRNEWTRLYEGKEK